jgi:methyl-accepting chemotaxis protein
MINFSNWKIKYQISTPIIFLLAALLLISAFGWSINAKLSVDIQKITDDLAPASVAVLNADRDLYQSIVALKDYTYLSSDPSHNGNAQTLLSDYRENQQQAYDRMLKARKLSQAGGMKLPPREAQNFIRAFENWKSLAEKTIQQVKTNNHREAQRLITQEGNKAFDELRDYYDKLGENLEEYRQMITTHAQMLAERQRFYTVSICLISMIIGLVGLFMIPQLIASKLKLLTDKMTELSQSGGDLTLRLPVWGKNELSELASATNEFIAYLHKMLQIINEEVTGITNHSEQLKTLAQRTGTSATEQNNALDDIAHSISELDTAIAEVAQQSQRSSDEANGAKTDITNSHKEIQLAIGQITDLVREMEGAAAVISKLEQDSQSITSVVDVIRGIAEQTNLLALNAAIEAARAGESGRGFAVVADEVRALAQKTQESTQSIQNTLSELNSGVEKAVVTIKSSSDKAIETSGYTDSAGTAMNLIIEKVSSITDFSVQIAAATEEQSTVVSQINNNMDQMREYSKEATINASESSTSINEVTDSIRKLSEQIASFKLS